MKRERRLGCRRPGRIPAELWLLAAEAAAEHGVEPTARKLQLNSERLEPWVAEWERTRRPAESAPSEFVELPPVLWGAPGECLVEVKEPSGRKLRISLNGSAVGQLATVLPLLCATRRWPHDSNQPHESAGVARAAFVRTRAA